MAGTSYDFYEVMDKLLTMNFGTNTIDAEELFSEFKPSGGGGDIFYVEVSYSSDDPSDETLVLNKTAKEILDAIDAGKFVVAKQDLSEDGTTMKSFNHLTSFTISDDYEFNFDQVFTASNAEDYPTYGGGK